MMTERLFVFKQQGQQFKINLLISSVGMSMKSLHVSFPARVLLNINPMGGSERETEESIVVKALLMD